MSDVMDTRRVGIPDRLLKLRDAIDRTLGVDGDEVVLGWIAELDYLADLCARHPNESQRRLAVALEREKERRRTARARVTYLENLIRSTAEAMEE